MPNQDPYGKGSHVVEYALVVAVALLATAFFTPVFDKVGDTISYITDILTGNPQESLTDPAGLTSTVGANCPDRFAKT